MAKSKPLAQSFFLDLDLENTVIVEKVSVFEMIKLSLILAPTCRDHLIPWKPLKHNFRQQPSTNATNQRNNCTIHASLTGKPPPPTTINAYEVPRA